MGATLQNFVTAGTHAVAISKENATLNESDMHLVCDTTLGAMTLILPKISTLGNSGLAIKLTVFDKGGVSDINNITIQSTTDLINNAASVVLNTVKGVMEIVIADGDNWAANLVSSAVPPPPH